MNVLSIKDLGKIGRDEPLFSGLTFGLNSGEKAALIGRNGSGKSTLLACIAGTLTTEEGSIVTARDCGISFLQQNPTYHPDDTILDHLFKSESAKLATIRQYEEVCRQLAEHPDSKQAAQRQSQLLEEMTRRDLWNYEGQIKQILTKLGITSLEPTMGSLSGGMVKKVALAQVLIDDTGLLLLDEPTNQLDVQSIAWLEDYLRTTERAVLMVTHDRYFLDNVCSSIYELARKRIKLYTGNYSQYLEKKTTEAEIEANTERRIESVLRTEREWLLRGPQARGTKARARVDAIQRMINREKFQADKGFSFEVADRRLGGTILELEGICKSWPDPEGNLMPVITDFSYIFRKGERLGIFGSNGAGKSTLLNLLTGRLEPDSGTVKTGMNTAFGYYQQNPQLEMAQEGCHVPTVLEYIREAAEVITLSNGKSLSAARLLEQFGFEGRIQHSAVTQLSGGELKRLYLVRLLMGNPNFLVLDEPTNDFDIFTLSILESFLEGYGGCLVVVSHDRCFMDKTVDTLLVLDGRGGISGFAGTCSEYLELLRQEERSASSAGIRSVSTKSPFAASPPSKSEARQPASAPNPKAAAPAQPRRRTYKEQQEWQALEEKIMEDEERKSELEALLSGGETDFSRLGVLTEEYNQLARNLEAAYLRWEELAELKEY